MTNPIVADSDDDGLTDGYEVNTSSTDLTDTDTDEDGLSDGEEIIGIISVANNNYYELIEGSFTWHAARDDAISKGGHLATITSSNEWSIVDAIIVGDVWLGATDENSEGQWEWITGEAWNDQVTFGDLVLQIMQEEFLIIFIHMIHGLGMMLHQSVILMVILGIIIF